MVTAEPCAPRESACLKWATVGYGAWSIALAITSEMIRAYILIIGSMKSGTTTLFDLLSEHPMIAPCRFKEPGFFAFEEQWREGFEAYEKLFDFCPDQHVYAMDGSTDYTKHPHCAGVARRLAASAPRRFKLIYLMRNPLRRIESHARHTQISRREVGRIVSPRPDHSLDAGISPVSMSISRYATQIDHYRAAYEAGELLLLSFEELVQDQRSVLQRVLKFLELPEFDAENMHSNVAGGTSEPSTVWLRLARVRPLAAIVKRVVPEKLRLYLRKWFSRKPRLRGRFRLTEEEEGQLLDELRPEFERLQSDYGFDARAWMRASERR